ncbi:type II and III secretion system protein family protein [Burkholderia cepacia]|uniref:type II and III secretion system protein family protein n=1 Tax=Burkholderia cepacia TaxID=292 RepID=UPI001CF2C2EF|nr:type II and III secretion system protein family protein [Burkholderia cepacia]MCA8110095.1 type II and III secretion system protein family protein [Burkholderia cepacia]MCA8396393.1 type II and III secretion system protein family protein [Burkholderia cepacia]
MVRMVRWIAFLGLACGIASGGAAAQVGRPPDAGAALSIATGKGELLSLPEPATAMFVADPAIADIQVPSPRTVFVFGKKAGTTTLIALGANHRPILRKTVIVQVDTASLQGVLDSRFPQLKLSVSGAPGSLMVSGKVPSAADADAVMQSLTPYLHDKEKIVNRLTLSRPIQVNLRVRVTEVSRNITQQLGINWSSLGGAGNFVGGLFNGRTLFDPTTSLFNLSPTGAFSVLGGFRAGRWSIDVVLDALDQEGLITMLAEPNLTAMSGETASFLAGGEIPIPVAQAGSSTGAITVEFKPFGVSLDFTPTVLADNRISLKVRPEVSEVDANNSVTTGGVKVPGLTVRRVETTVELSSGQSFAIGGLLQSQTADTVSQIPGLGRLPIIGRLFSSKNFQDNKTEVVVIVTPYIVQPAGPGQLEQAIDTVARPSSDLEFAVQRNLGLDLLSGDTPRLVGAAGFVY